MEVLKMTDLNNVCVGGRITKDAEIEKTKDGVSFVRFTIACNRSKRKKDSNEYEDKVSFIEFTPIFGSYAESMVKHLKKGTYVTVEGHNEMESWISEDGKKHQQLRVVPTVGAINPWVGGKKDNASSSEVKPEPAPEEMNDFVPDVY